LWTNWKSRICPSAAYAALEIDINRGAHKSIQRASVTSEQAKDDWKMGRFTPVPGETESIPLPEL
ncbi:MAG: hypothetical protein WB500_14920, partial [Rhodoplanes sp.]